MKKSIKLVLLLIIAILTIFLVFTGNGQTLNSEYFVKQRQLDSYKVTFENYTLKELVQLKDQGFYYVWNADGNLKTDINSAIFLTKEMLKEHDNTEIIIPQIIPNRQKLWVDKPTNMYLSPTTTYTFSPKAIEYHEKKLNSDIKVSNHLAKKAKRKSVKDTKKAYKIAKKEHKKANKSYVEMDKVIFFSFVAIIGVLMTVNLYIP